MGLFDKLYIRNLQSWCVQVQYWNHSVILYEAELLWLLGPRSIWQTIHSGIYRADAFRYLQYRNYSVILYEQNCPDLLRPVWQLSIKESTRLKRSGTVQELQCNSILAELPRLVRPVWQLSIRNPLSFYVQVQYRNQSVILYEQNYPDFHGLVWELYIWNIQGWCIQVQYWNFSVILYEQNYSEFLDLCLTAIHQGSTGLMHSGRVQELSCNSVCIELSRLPWTCLKAIHLESTWLMHSGTVQELKYNFIWTELPRLLGSVWQLSIKDLQGWCI